jgi:hypothetical protein
MNNNNTVNRAFHFGTTISKNTTLQLDCECFIFQNQGNTLVTLDDYFELTPSEALSVTLNRAGERFFQDVRIKFGKDNVLRDGQEPTNKLNYAHILPLNQ